MDNKEEEIKAIKHFKHELMNTIEENKAILKMLKDEFGSIEEPSYHEQLMYATAKAFLKLPVSDQNIFLARQFMFKSTQDLADYLRVSRPTLTSYLSKIKKTIIANANKYLKSLNN